jgi:CRISPR-associated protein Cmr6
MTLVLPERTTNLVASLACDHRHPGLQLDKLSEAGDQAAQRAALESVGKTRGDSELLSALNDRRHRLLAGDPGMSWFSATTAGPLTLHLARASALENAGICLHPLYGFVYLPGSGLKGMARAYATAVAKASDSQIASVFGNEPGEPAKERQSAGSVVFHDAWPIAWPNLIVDIVNNHHGNYYSPPDTRSDYPPGDWEDPVPVYFLAVPADHKFEFALAKRRTDVADAHLHLARQWLEGALCHLGAGAKTAAGYGSFKLEAAAAPGLPPSRKEFTTTLELVTPAFLAGASQQPDDCDLRSATLRGLLRWWWRTMHAGFVDVATLRRMEALVWGDTKQGGAVRIELRRVKVTQPQKYAKRSLADMGPAEKKGDYGIPGLDPQKTTQGLWYASYGMDDKGKPRWYLDPGSSWECRLTVRGSVNGATENDLIEQGIAALWLLCQYGGVGAKSRKGFGSLSATSLDGWSSDRCRTVASEFRSTQGAAAPHQDRLAGSPSIEQLLRETTARFDWPSIWGVLDQIGFAYQACAKRFAHRREKRALGLPRKIGRGPQDAQGTFQPTGAFADYLTTVKNRDNARHASPVHFQVSRFDGAYLVRVVAFPGACLPDLNSSRAFLTEFMGFLAVELERRSGLRPPRTAKSPNTPQTGKPGTGPRTQSPTARDGAVQAKYLGPHDKFHWVQEPAKRKGLVKYGTPPDPLPQPDSEITVYPTNQSINSPEYSWTPPNPPPPQRRDGGRGRGGRR